MSKRILARSVVLLIHLVRSRMSRAGIPQKAQANLTAGRPILLAVKGDSLDLFRQTGAGLACGPQYLEAMAERVKRFSELDGAQC